MPPKLLGRGSYSRVYIHEGDYAIKETINPKWIDGIGSIKDYQVYCWQIDDSDRLVPYINVVSHRKAFQNYLTSKYDGNYDPFKYVMPKMIDCSKFYQRHSDDLESALQQVARDVILDLVYLNEHGFVHLDVKPDNILEQNGKYRLCDFGFITHISSDKSKCVGRCSFTPGYSPPEHIRGYVASMSGDSWSLGASLYEMATGLYMVPLKCQDHLNHAKEFQSSGRWIDVFNKRSSHPDGELKNQLIDFISKCMTYDHRKRPTPKELMQHPYIKLELPYVIHTESVKFPSEKLYREWANLVNSSTTNYLTTEEIIHGTALYLKFCERVNAEPRFPSNTWGICLYLIYKLLTSPSDVVKFDCCIPYRFIREHIRTDKLYKYETVVITKCKNLWFDLDDTVPERRLSR